jgi:acetyl-CoA C-acetyltransferase
VSDRTKPVLVDGARTPIGRFRGALADVPAVALGAHAVRAALARCPGLDPDYAILGNVLQAANGQNPGRQAAVRGGLPRDVPGTTLNDVCLSSMSAVAVAASMLHEGEAQCVLVGGFDSMSGAPHAVHVRGARASGDARLVDVMIQDGLWCQLSDAGMGSLSDRENERLGITREAQDAFALRSHERAAAATDSGRLGEEIEPFGGAKGRELSEDEGIRRDTSIDKLSSLPPAFTPEGTITAGNASQISDGATAGIVTSLERAQAFGLAPVAEIGPRAVIAGPDSSLHLRPAEAVRRLLERARLAVSDIDLWEVNEAFSGVVLATIEDLRLDPEHVNVNGGAVALGHPLAASGLRLVLTLAYELRHRGGALGVAAICGGGGQGEAILLRAV